MRASATLLTNQAFNSSAIVLHNSSARRAWPGLHAQRPKHLRSREGVDQILVLRPTSQVFLPRLASGTTVGEPSGMQRDTAVQPSDLELRDKMSHAYGHEYAIRSSDEGFGERYGEPVDVFNKDDTSESRKSASPELKVDLKSSKYQRSPAPDAGHKSGGQINE